QFMNAKEMTMKHSTIAKTFTIAAVTALVLAVAPRAKADDKGCSNTTLQGSFAYTVTGFLVAAPAPVGPYAEAGAQTFDGRGGTAAIGMSSTNGTIMPQTNTGAY